MTKIPDVMLRQCVELESWIPIGAGVKCGNLTFYVKAYVFDADDLRFKGCRWTDANPCKNLRKYRRDEGIFIPAELIYKLAGQ
jgi:hypothetical protein